MQIYQNMVENLRFLTIWKKS